MNNCSFIISEKITTNPLESPSTLRNQSHYSCKKKSSVKFNTEKIEEADYSSISTRALNKVKQVKSYVQTNPNLIFWSGIGLLNSYRLLDSGLAKLLCLETLRHGTSLSAYIAIHLNGPNPSFGGTGGCESSYFCRDSINWFHAVPDTNFSHKITDHPILNEILKPFSKRLIPRLYATLAQANQVHKFITSDQIFNGNYNYRNLIFDIPGALLGSVVPTVKLRFRPEEIAEKFIRDNTMPDNTAIRTHEHISIFHTGITGSLIQGLDNGLFQRISNDPLTALTGILYITASVYLAKQTYAFIQNQSKTIEKTQFDVAQTSTWKQRCIKYILYPSAIGASMLLTAI